MQSFIKQRFTQTDSYLGNPHKGCCTFQHFNKDPLYPHLYWSEEGPTEFPSLDIPRTKQNAADRRSQSPLSHVEGYLPSTVAYCRWFWKIIEPSEGVYDFSFIEKSMQVAQSRGQTVAVRLMAFGSQTQVQLPQWYIDRYPCTTATYKSAEQIIPIHDSPAYLKKWGDCIRAFAEQYDNDPRLESIDVSFIGPWGEGDGDCSLKQCTRFAELWDEAFTNTPRLALVDGIQLAESIQRGSGWRCDCFGDLRSPGSPDLPRHLSWNHMYDAYPMQIPMANAQNSWQHAPVHFESCGVPMQWHLRGYDIDFIIEQGLKYHGSYFMPKYTQLPEEWIDKLSAFCRKLGYRYMYRQSKIDSGIKAGENMHLESWIENIGVAPIYRHYTFAVRFKQNGQEEIIHLNDIDIRQWMPGDTWLSKDIMTPSWLKNGPCDVSVGLVDSGNIPRIKFAIIEQYPNAWVPLGNIHII